MASRAGALATVVRHASTAGAAILALVGVFADLLPIGWRIGAIIVAALLWLCGEIADWRVRRRQSEEHEEVVHLAEDLIAAKKRIDASAPDQTLDGLAQALFPTKGAWRLSVYFLFQKPDATWWLRRVVRRSGSEPYELSGRLAFPIERSVLRDLSSMDLTSALRPYVNQTGAFSSREATPDEWLSQQTKFLAKGEARALTMPTRKYAWCATRDVETRQTVVLVAESVDPEGINVEILETPVVPPMLTMIARAVDVAATVAGPVQAAATHLAKQPGNQR